MGSTGSDPVLTVHLHWVHYFLFNFLKETRALNYKITCIIQIILYRFDEFRIFFNHHSAQLLFGPALPVGILAIDRYNVQITKSNDLADNV